MSASSHPLRQTPRSRRPVSAPASDTVSAPHTLLEAILSASTAFLFVIDPQGRCLYANWTGAPTLSQDQRTIVGNPPAEIGLPEPLVRQLTEECAHVFAAGQGMEGAAAFPDLAGKTRHFAHTLAPVHGAGAEITAVVVTVRDVTETWQTQENLQLAVSAAGLGTFTCDWPLDQIICNETCREQFFLSQDAPFTLRLFYDLLHPGDREPTRLAMERSIEMRQEYQVEYRVVAPDGRFRWINAIGRLLCHEDGQPASFDGITIDITARKRAEEERDCARQEADQRAAELASIYEREHRIAEALQRSLLIRPPVSLTGLEVETVYQAAWEEAEVGGDYYDFFALESDKLALVVGDVSGKGLESASRTAEMKFTLRAYLRENAHAATALARTNAFLCESQALERHTNDYFVCIALAIVDTTAGTLEVCAAGTEPPFLLHAGGELLEIRAGGMPLGVSFKSDYTAAHLTFDAGDLLLIATDGLTEARCGHEFLGGEGLAQLARQALNAGTLAQTGQSILDGAQDFAGGHLHDDACLLLARRLPQDALPGQPACGGTNFKLTELIQ